MKRKILINGRNQLMISDFLQHTESFFDTLSTSASLIDIVGHFKFFQPEVYVMFMDNGYEQTVQQITSLKNSDFYNGAVIVLIGDADSCNQAERGARNMVDLIIRRPITSDNLALRITRYLDEMDEDKARRVTIQEKADQMDAIIKAAEAALSSATASAVSAGGASAAAAGSGKKHILVVDDDRTVLKMVKTALSDTYDVTTMANGAMLDKLLDAKKVDLIILDYEMPVETGADIFRRIKKKNATAQIPVCFLTGVSDRAKIMEVMSLKPHGYILKPIDMDMLSSTIKNLIG